MEFHAYLKILPSWPFGVPDTTGVLVPNGRQEAVDPSLPSLSVPRREGEAIQLSGAWGDVTYDLRDNALTIHAAVPSRSAARELALEIGNRVARGLTLARGMTFHVVLERIEDHAPRSFDERTYVGGTAHFYNLGKMRRAMQQALAFAASDDPVLGKALIYFEHAQVLMDQAVFHPTLASRSLLITIAFLSLCKSLTAILGDPTKDRRDYQSRCRTLGYPKRFWQTSVKPLLEIRNDLDVAHYSLDASVDPHLKGTYWKAERLVRECIVRYARSRLQVDSGEDR